MAVELAERVGPSLEWWIPRPYAFARWTFLHLKLLDRRRQWAERLRMCEAAVLTNWAMHDPERIRQHENSLLAEGAGGAQAIDDDDLAIARRLIDNVSAGGVLVDGR